MNSSSKSPESLDSHICATQELINLKQLKIEAPHLFTQKGLEDSKELVLHNLLKILHTEEGQNRIKAHPQLSQVLTGTSFLREHNHLSFAPLFSGTFYIVCPKFRIGTSPNAFYAWDSDTILEYAALAVKPISVFAAQYGKNEISVHPEILEYDVYLNYPFCSDYHVKEWVRDVVILNNLPEDSCVVFMIPPEITNIDIMGGLGSGYHGYTSIPYIYSQVGGKQLTIGDSGDYFAGVLSHEIAEVVVNPKANFENPEVCDGCADNCSNLYLVFFDQNIQYIKTIRRVNFPVDFAYHFFINAIISPSYALHPAGCIPRPDAVTREVACSYGFPDVRIFNPPQGDRPLPNL